LNFFAIKGLRSFTLAELVIVILIAGILGAVGLPIIGGAFADMGLRSAAQRLVADLNYMRNMAITEGSDCGFEFTGATYKAFKLGAGGVHEQLIHPIKHTPWAVDTSDDKIKLAPDFSGTAEMYFDASGSPHPAGTIVLAANGLTITITVQAGTGRVSAQRDQG